MVIQCVHLSHKNCLIFVQKLFNYDFPSCKQEAHMGHISLIFNSKSLKVNCGKRTDSNSNDNSKQNSNIQISGSSLKTHCGF